MRRLLPLLLATALLAGCGDNDETPAATATPPAGDTRLTIEVGGDGVDPQTIEIDCVTDPCDVDKLRKATAPPDGTVACTEIYGGPEEAHVTGTLRGEPVDRKFHRADGCGIADYEALFQALGREPPVAG